MNSKDELIYFCTWKILLTDISQICYILKLKIHVLNSKKYNILVPKIIFEKSDNKENIIIT
jgi:hypothetical protein